MAGAEQSRNRVIADDLLEIAKADTAFADLYLQRARELLSAELSEEQWAQLGHLDRQLGELTATIGAAVEASDWELVRDLTSRAEGLKRIVAERAPLRASAARVYGFDEILVDPFSPGMSGLAGVPQRELPALRDAAVKRLDRLGTGDPACAALYRARRKALAELQLARVSSSETDGDSSAANLRLRIQSALAQGDMSQVHLLSTQLLKAQGQQTSVTEQGADGPSAPDLVQPFPKEACERAGKLALAPHRLESVLEHLRQRFRPTWSVMPGGPDGSTIRLSVTMPGDAEAAEREAVTLYATRPFLTSVGTRYIPWFVEEDVLVEDFDEGASPEASSPLLAALGLPGRTGLSRSKIEKALRKRGADVVKDLALDPVEHRLVCIPMDVYTRVGAKLGWGKRPIWTHLDGYMASSDRKLMPLVGGDVRFGGLRDLVAVSADYDSERLLARFAVVQRRRFRPW